MFFLCDPFPFPMVFSWWYLGLWARQLSWSREGWISILTGPFSEFSLNLAAMLSVFLLLLLMFHLGVFVVVFFGSPYSQTKPSSEVPMHFRSLLCLYPEPCPQISHHWCPYSGPRVFFNLSSNNFRLQETRSLASDSLMRTFALMPSWMISSWTWT